MQKISRDINLSESPNAKERVRALSHIYALLSDSYTLSVADYSELFGEICRPIFKRYADSSEKSRDLAFRISIFLFEVSECNRRKLSDLFSSNPTRAERSRFCTCTGILYTGPATAGTSHFGL